METDNVNTKEQQKHHSGNIDQIADALAKASAEIKPASKANDNLFYKSKYADLASIDEVCRPALAKNGLSITQVMDNDGGMLTLITILLHSSGQWIKSYYPITYDKTTPQAIGSGVTYARRYSIAAICNIVTEDDDGEAATDRGKHEPKSTTISNLPEKSGQLKVKGKTKSEYVTMMQNAGSLEELAKIESQMPKEWKTEKFLEFSKGLADKFKPAHDEGTFEDVKQMFDLQPVELPAAKPKGGKK